MGRIRLALVDLSGTLHVGSEVIAGGPEALCRLRESGVKVRFVTNTSRECAEDVRQRVCSLGYEITREEMWTSLTAARRLVEKRGWRPMMFLSESAKRDFHGVDCHDPNAVVIGLAPEKLNYHGMNQAFRLLDAGGELIAVNIDRYFKAEDGLCIGPGAFAAAFEYSTNVKTHNVGKPSRDFFQTALHGMDVDASETVMIGDDAVADCAGALEADLGYSLLVKTGKYKTGDETAEERQDRRPSATVPDFAAAVQWILDRNQSNSAAIQAGTPAEYQLSS